MECHGVEPSYTVILEPGSAVPATRMGGEEPAPGLPGGIARIVKPFGGLPITGAAGAVLSTLKVA